MWPPLLRVTACDWCHLSTDLFLHGPSPGLQILLPVQKRHWLFEVLLFLSRKVDSLWQWSLPKDQDRWLTTSRVSFFYTKELQSCLLIYCVRGDLELGSLYLLIHKDLILHLELNNYCRWNKTNVTRNWRCLMFPISFLSLRLSCTWGRVIAGILLQGSFQPKPLYKPIIFINLLWQYDVLLLLSYINQFSNLNYIEGSLMITEMLAKSKSLHIMFPRL